MTYTAALLFCIVAAVSASNPWNLAAHEYQVNAVNGHRQAKVNQIAEAYGASSGTYNRDGVPGTSVHGSAYSAGHGGNAYPSGHGGNAYPAGHGGNAYPAGHGGNAYSAGYGGNALSAGHDENAYSVGHVGNSYSAGHGGNAYPAGHSAH